MPFEACGFVEDAERLPAELEEVVGDDDAGGEGGGARAHAFAERNVVIDLQLDGGQREVVIGGNALGGAPDQVVGASRDEGAIASMDRDGEGGCPPEAAFEINP